MRPVPIPKEYVWEDSERAVIGPPDDDPTGAIRAVESVVDAVRVGDLTFPRFNLRIELDPADLAALAEDPHLWISILGSQLPPFDVALIPAGVSHAS